jgi:tetratricopeptide (TPR) repeat protein
MAHLSEAEFLCAIGAGRAEIERMAAHLGLCPACRALAARLLEDRALPSKREAPLRMLLDLAAFERQAAVERLLARAELADLTRQTRAAQKERVIRSRSCHTSAFIDLLLAGVRAPHPKDEAEFLSGLAVLAVQGMDEKRNSAAFKNDLLGTIWTETANARRIHGEWPHAHAALKRAARYLEAGTGNSALRARWLSITASLQADQGARAEAMASLEECRGIYEARREWPLVARTLVQMAHCTVEHDPAQGLALLDRSGVASVSEDPTLRWIAESIRVECLVTIGRVEEALLAFQGAERWRPLQQRPNSGVRSAFTAARLLEALGYTREAEALFDEALSGDLEAGLHKDALLDLLYIFGFHVRGGQPERAAELSLRTLAEIERQGTVLHEQLRSVWTKLIDTGREQSLDDQMLREAGEYLRAYWKNPAPAEPIFASGERGSAPAGTSPIAADERLISPLLARALWSRIRRETRKNQQQSVTESPECHTRDFADLLLGELRAAPSRDEAEFIASLALRAAEGMAEPAAFAEDFLAQVWTEIANVRRIAAEWNHGRAALRHSGEHLSRGSGDPLLKGRMRSVAASLSGDQGYRPEALQILAECQALYEEEGAVPLVARTLVQTAHTLVESAPVRALALAEKALVMIPAHDAVLRWLAESIRTESLIETGDTGQALQAFQIAESLRASHARADAETRSNYTAARLLEALGHVREAEQLFEAVIAEAFEREAYREAFLDILYLFGVHLRQGATEKAVALCRFALARLDLFDVGHEQLRAVWMELRDAATRRAIRLESLAEVRQFLKVHWKTPAVKAPRLSLR